MRYLTWFCALLFFAFQFIIRMWLGVNTDFIMAQYSIDIDMIGKLASYYYFGYAISQIPVAIILEKYGSRKTISSAAILCGVAHLVFTSSDNINIALFCRFIIGACSACGFLGVSKVLTDCFSRESYSKMVGFSFTFGFLGAIIGGKPLLYLASNFNSSYISISLGIVAIIIGLLCVIFLNSPKYSIDKPLFNKSTFRKILNKKIVIGMSIVMFCMVGVVEVYADMWAVNHIMITYKISKTEAAGIVSFIFMGIIVGGPILAFLSKFSNEQSVIVFSGTIYAILFYVLLFAVTKNIYIISLICFLIGVVCCFKVMMFALSALVVSNKELGLVIALLNSANMMGGSFINNMIGKFMQVMWSGQFNKMKVKIYDVVAYQYSLSIIIYSILIGTIIMYLLTKIYLKNKDCN